MHSSDFVNYTCKRVSKQVRKLYLGDIAAEVASGELDIETALRQAAMRGADTAQTFGAEQVRAAFDAYIRDVEAGKTPQLPVKAGFKSEPTVITVEAEDIVYLGGMDYAADEARLGQVWAATLQLVGDKYTIVDARKVEENAEDTKTGTSRPK